MEFIAIYWILFNLVFVADFVIVALIIKKFIELYFFCWHPNQVVGGFSSKYDIDFREVSRFLTAKEFVRVCAVSKQMHA